MRYGSYLGDKLYFSQVSALSPAIGVNTDKVSLLTVREDALFYRLGTTTVN
jgi:hypothetical protein